MSTTDDTANDSNAGQSTRRRVHTVPHTHWDRECSGGVASRLDAAETWSAATYTNGRLPSRQCWSRGAEDSLRTGATRSRSPNSSGITALRVMLLPQIGGLRCR
jgi:hypothetical protein